ncbi:MAG TPA: hypothetical protein GX701_04010 [Clostridiales bacterium]|nr:hypothetical protein [Clostridiales bacterium]
MPDWFVPVTVAFMGLVLIGLLALLIKVYASSGQKVASAAPVAFPQALAAAGVDPAVVAAISAAVYTTLAQTNPNASFTIRSIRRETKWNGSR